MRTISKILEEENVKNIIPEDLNASDITCMKYTPINNADIERSFSMYKNLLTVNKVNMKLMSLLQIKNCFFFCRLKTLLVKTEIN